MIAHTCACLHYTFIPLSDTIVLQTGYETVFCAYHFNNFYVLLTICIGYLTTQSNV